MLAILAPGQGAQTPGLLAPWLELPGVADRLRWWSAAAGLDLVALGTTADAEAIRDTAVAQPLIVATGLAAAAELLDASTAGVAATGGHSVGELTAAVVAGALSAEAAMVLVAARGRAMAAASAEPATGMSAVLGGDPDTVVGRLAGLGLEPANVNGAGQVVAAGLLADLARLAEQPPDGARVRPLAVAGAFHTRYMAAARDALGTLAAGAPFRDPRLPLLSNADGSVVRSGAELRARLVDQVVAPVRWDACQATLDELGVTAAIELPPAGTLTGLLRRTLPRVETVALRTPADLPAARALLAAHRDAGHAGEPAPLWRVLVAPLGGTFRRESVEPGRALAPGTPVGAVVSRRSSSPVATPYGGVLVEWLAEDGDPVGPGQPLARLHPEAVPA